MKLNISILLPAQADKGKTPLDVEDLPPLDIKPAECIGHVDVNEIRIEQQLSLKAQGIAILSLWNKNWGENQALFVSEETKKRALPNYRFEKKMFRDSQGRRQKEKNLKPEQYSPRELQVIK